MKIEEHITILGALYIGFNTLGIMAAMIVFVTLMGSGIISGDEEALAILTGIATFVSYLLFITCAPGIIGGFGLLKRKNWARILVIVLGFINLLAVPFGTVLGIYTLYVLLKDEAPAEFTEKPAAREIDVSGRDIR